MDLSVELLKLLNNGGMPTILFVIWYYTMKMFQKQSKDQLTQIFKLMEDDVKYKELLTGILTRLEIKVDYNNKNEAKK
jgi:hypothetical protein